MEDTFKFLLVMAIIVIGIVRQFKKEAEKNAGQRPAMPVPDADNPLPGYEDEESYGKQIIEDPPAEPEPVYQPSVKPADRSGGRKQQDQPKKHTTVSACSSAKVSPPPVADVNSQDSDETSEFNIRSAEEARKAIIWSEILQRKYYPPLNDGRA